MRFRKKGLFLSRLTEFKSSKFDLRYTLQQWFDRIEIRNPRIAHLLCRFIPAQCPFERDISFFGRQLVHIPAFCKLNPFYEQLVGLRFRSLSYLADQCGEDVRLYY
jgi:Mo-dependent nitrogenase C-terminus